ncbi:WD repeat-containing protein 74 [Fopius arisanus]|uniref:WD repeat-containing protein 74 n=1 Tax=Fopius arisanus TaxID=64838 RepID=A0A9R1TKH1_9HYME|nr:PREDICTED: WD repeat-containing protein 74 [Fopius arisanus]
MKSKDDFDLFVGGKSGVFKGIKYDKSLCKMKNLQNLVSITSDHEVTAMSWSDENEDEVLIGYGTKDKKGIKIYECGIASFASTFICEAGDGSIRGISRYDDAILTAVESGDVKLWRNEDMGELLVEAGKNLHRMRPSSVDKNVIATGGNEHKLQLFDLEKQTRIFEEKNVRHDWLELKVPLWISDIGFLSESSQIATCSRYGHVRLYDPSAQRRPVINLEVKDEALTTLAVAPKEKHIIIGSGKGIMNLIDLRSPGRILNTYKDSAGSITSIACTRNNPYVVSVGLDRHLRVHHIDTKKLLHKTYLTSRLSCMVLRSNADLDIDPSGKKKREGDKADGVIEVIEATDEQEEKTIVDECDEIFDKMPVIEDEIHECRLPGIKKRVLSSSTRRNPAYKKNRVK